MPSVPDRRWDESEPTRRSESILSRLPWLISLTAMFSAVVCYGLRIKEGWFYALQSRWEKEQDFSFWARFCRDQIEPFIGFYHSVLILKAVAAALCVLALFGVVFAAKVLSPVSGSEGPDPKRAADRSRPSRWAFSTWIVFLLWCLISIYWSPSRALSIEGAPWIIVLGGFGYFLLRRGMNFERARELAWLFVVLGTVVAAISLLEATEAFGGVIYLFLLRFDEIRNRFGSLLGHTIEVASFLLMTGFPALALAVGSRRLLARVYAWAYLALILITMVVVQSRAIWILAPILGAGFIWTASRQTNARWPRRVATFALIVLVMAIASQTIDKPWNFLYGKGTPLIERLHDLSPERLMKETRLRILLCSGSLIAERPIAGHGLYAFPAVYPTAQAKYFARHPETRLGVTTFRTRMAHNEYLQVLIEQGAIGLLMLLAVLGEIGWRGWQRNKTLTGSIRLLHAAFGFSSLALTVHALVHFPFHNSQLLMPWLFCLAAFASLRDRNGGDEEAAEAAPNEAEASSEFMSRRLRPGHVLRLVVAGALILGVPFSSYSFVRLLQADVDYCYGASDLSLLLQYGTKLPKKRRDRAIVDAITRLGRAIRWQPSHDNARFTLGGVYYAKGLFEAKEEPLPPDPQSGVQAAAAQSFRTAIEYYKACLTTLTYHQTFSKIAYAYDGLMKVTSEERDPELRKAYELACVKNFELAVYYMPSLENELNFLAEWHARQPEPNMRKVVDYRRRIKKWHRAAFHEKYYLKVVEELDHFQYETAASGAEALLQVDSQEPMYLIDAINAHMMAGRPIDRTRVLELIQVLRSLKFDPARYEVHPIYGSFAALYEALITEHWDKALEELNHQGAFLPKTRATLLAIEQYARMKLNRPLLPTRFARPQDMTEEDWARLTAERKAHVLFRWLRELDAADEAFEARERMAGDPPGLEFWVDWADLSKQRGSAARRATCLEQIERLQPGHPSLDHGAEAVRD